MSSEHPEHQSQLTQVRPQTNLTTVIEHKSEIHMHQISEDQLDNLFSAQPSLGLLLATTCLGVFVSMLSVLLAGINNASPASVAAMTGITYASGILMVPSALFGGYSQYKRSQLLKRLRSSR